MAKHPHQIDIGPSITSTRSYGKILAGASGVVETVQYKSDAAAVGSSKFDLKINGVSIYASPTDRPTIPNTGTAVTVDLFTALALSPAVVKGDLLEFLIELSGGSIGANLYSQITIEDGLTPFYGGTSATSQAIVTGSKTFATQKGLGYVVGSRVRLASLANPTVNFMEGVVTSYSGTSLIVTIDIAAGSGTHTDWQLSIAGQRGPTGASGVVESVQPGTNVTVDSTDPANPIVSSTGGGGVGAGIDTPPSSPSVYDDEFDGPTLDPKWTATLSGSGHTYAIGTEPAVGWLQFLAAAGVGGYTFTQSFPMGSGDFSFTMKMCTEGVTNFQGLQVFLENSGTTDGFRIALYASSGGTLVHLFPAFTLKASAQPPNVSSVGYWHIQRISNVWTFWMSSNGLTWNANTPDTQTFTIDQIRITFDQSGATTKYRGFIDWVRCNWIFL